jgi:hypothetical protein
MSKFAEGQVVKIIQTQEVGVISTVDPNMRNDWLMGEYSVKVIGKATIINPEDEPEEAIIHMGTHIFCEEEDLELVTNEN